MVNVNNRRRQAKGTPIGGQFATEARTEPNVSLTPNVDETGFSSFEQIANTVLPEDEKDALDSTREELFWHSSQYGGSLSEWVWDNKMGSGTRRTAANRARYHQLMDEKINSTPELVEYKQTHAKWLAQHRAYGRAYQQGIPIDPQLETEFESMWAGKSLGRSQEEFEQELARNRRILEHLNTGLVTPRSIVGKGATKASATKWLEGQIRDGELALQTRGRSYTVNVSNALYRVKQKQQ